MLVAGCSSGYRGGMTTALERPRSGKIIGGVCAALAARFGLPKFLVRLGFVIFGLVGIGEIVYIALWIMIPKAPV
jgi:phage shock protein PspC (stress-responsive transcriptional regulator)